MHRIPVLAALIVLSVACAHASEPVVAKSKDAPAVAISPAPSSPATDLQKAVFAGGCFWCMESPFESLDGVSEVLSGYTGGAKKEPTYDEVSDGGTGHTEAVQVTFDPAKISYDKLLETFWKNIDPTVKDRQFCDKGNQYRSGIFYAGDAQKAAAEASKAALEKAKPFDAAIVTEVTAFDAFWPAEEYHQDYYKKNPVRYRYYRNGCGRDKRLKELWGAAAPH